MTNITSILVAIVTLISALITVFVIPWVKTKIAKDKQELVMNVADAVVLAVEQVYTALNGPEKKQEAVDRVKAWLKQYNITVDDKIIDDAIESCVKSMNINLKMANLE